MSQRRSSNHVPPEPEQPAMFTYRVDQVAKNLALGDKPKWRYPCGLCNGSLVSEPGGLCSTCAPTPPRSRRKTAKPRTAKKTTTAKTTKTSESSGRPRAKRVPPWDRVADGGAS
ncbi:MAG: hypothetical protein GEV10_06455 [Streptosporangiales bacterium]|nr:hypothetical protein [Streptosporangiales bacterium]